MQHNADQPAHQRLELLYHPRRLQKHEQLQGYQRSQEAWSEIQDRGEERQ